jgi:hypothetical protein
VPPATSLPAPSPPVQPSAPVIASPAPSGVPRWTLPPLPPLGPFWGLPVAPALRPPPRPVQRRRTSAVPGLALAAFGTFVTFAVLAARGLR